ncbi:hypothetical protein BC827DRAFT_200716 [Russula dissimulans]|nr:hypothetical protein BC827DRAFT_200716 [Russula dissimulans]
MIIIIAILAATRAFPLDPSSHLVSRDQLQPPTCSDPNGHRSLWDIIRSCLLTIFLCTWASVHPNIPSPDERWPRIALRRVGLMIAALIMPEVIIGWALRQRLAAGRLAEEHKEKGWTTTHGFFAIMGGFMEYDGNQPVRVLLPDQLESYSLTGNGDFPKISKAEITDKSKGDAISKAVVILQTGWFVTQCIARVSQRLPITELELVTIAFATLNIVIYVLWWHKPLNVQRGVRVYKQRITEQPIDDRDVEADMGFWHALLEALFELPAAIVHGPFTRELPHAPWQSRVMFWLFFKPQQFLCIGIGTQEYENLKRVTTFYPDKWGNRRTLVVGLALVAAIASTFGGIHCLGWLLTFPSSTQGALWLFASISIVVLPISLSLSLVPRLKERNYPNTLYVMNFILFSQLYIYMLCRLVLLVLPFLALRSLPPKAHLVVYWVSFIPHV